MTKVVHCKKEKYDVYIGRPSKWGNPFSWKEGTLAEFKVNNKEESIRSYRQWILNNPKLLSQLHELKGKILGCWCSPYSCHGDILIELLEEREAIDGNE